MEEIISSIAASSSVGHKDNRQLRCRNAGEGWLQPIFNLTILCRLQLQHLPNTPPAPKTPLVFLPLARSHFVLPPAPFAARRSWARSSHGAAPWRREWVSTAGAVGGSPTAEHRRQGEGQRLLPCEKSPLGFVLLLFGFHRQGFIRLSTKTKGSAQRKRGNHFNPKGCCISLPIAC